jgi:hypothetical protein
LDVLWKVVLSSCSYWLKLFVNQESNNCLHRSHRHDHKGLSQSEILNESRILDGFQMSGKMIIWAQGESEFWWSNFYWNRLQWGESQDNHRMWASFSPGMYLWLDGTQQVLPCVWQGTPNISFFLVRRTMQS